MKNVLVQQKKDRIMIQITFSVKTEYAASLEMQ